MKQLTVSLVALVTLGVGVSMEIGADAAATEVNTAPAHVRKVERRLDWSTRHIRKLNRRRDHLHAYIKHMRQRYSAPVSSPVQTATSSTTTTSSGGGWADELAAVGFPSSAIPTMLAIIDRESGGDPNAINSSSGACGLTQLYPCYGGSAWLDPMTNLRLAHQKYVSAGFAPWATSG